MGDPLTMSLSAGWQPTASVASQLSTDLLMSVREWLTTFSVRGVLSDRWQSLADQFSAIWIADGSTLEELGKRLKICCAASESRLAG